MLSSLILSLTMSTTPAPAVDTSAVIVEQAGTKRASVRIGTKRAAVRIDAKAPSRVGTKRASVRIGTKRASVRI